MLAVIRTASVYAWLRTWRPYAGQAALRKAIVHLEGRQRGLLQDLEGKQDELRQARQQVNDLNETLDLLRCQFRDARASYEELRRSAKIFRAATINL